MTARQSTGTPVSIADWAGSPLSTVHHLAAQPQPIPIEQFPDGASYVLRLEVPGVDPADGLAVSVDAGTLTVQAERPDSAPAGRQSEFRYGSLARRVPLPPGADADAVSASYHNGILTVRIGLKPEYRHGSRAIDIAIEP